MGFQKKLYTFNGEIDWVIHLNRVETTYFEKLEFFSNLKFLIKPQLDSSLSKAMLVIECFLSGSTNPLDKLIQLERNLIATE